MIFIIKRITRSFLLEKRKIYIFSYTILGLRSPETSKARNKLFLTFSQKSSESKLYTVLLWIQWKQMQSKYRQEVLKGNSKSCKQLFCSFKEGRHCFKNNISYVPFCMYHYCNLMDYQSQYYGFRMMRSSLYLCMACCSFTRNVIFLGHIFRLLRLCLKRLAALACLTCLFWVVFLKFELSFDVSYSLPF